jgi:hypothetical protein
MTVDESSVWEYVNERWSQMDRWLVDIGWQPDRSDWLSNRVLLHMMLRKSVSDLVDVRLTADACLFTMLSFAGEEIAYPKSFFDSSGPGFWDETLRVCMLCSGEMMRANKDCRYYMQLLGEYSDKFGVHW